MVINQDNIQPGKEHNFVKRSRGQGSEDVAGVEGSYDFYSLLHYPGKESNGNKTKLKRSKPSHGGGGHEIITKGACWPCTDIVQGEVSVFDVFYCVLCCEELFGPKSLQWELDQSFDQTLLIETTSLPDMPCNGRCTVCVECLTYLPHT